MIAQHDLPFDTPAAREVRRARVDGPDTSREAARQSHGLAARHTALILDVLRSNDLPLSAHEIAAACHLQPVQVSRRLGQLRDDGVIVVGNRIATTPTGRPAQTWEIAKP